MPKFKYVLTKNALMPYVPIILAKGRLFVEKVALVDSGAEISVLPYQIGIDLGLMWDDRQAKISLGGTLQTAAIPVTLRATLFNLAPVDLFFAWAASDMRLILGQTNFFTEFHVCFLQNQGYFEISSK